MRIEPTIIIDSREQRFWQFKNLSTEPGSLAAGDYSIKGLEHLITVERKSLDDLLACIGRQRDRFRRELQRLKAYRFRCLVIEASYTDLERGEWRSQVKPNHVLGSLAAWMCQFQLPIFLAGNHKSAAQFAERYLYQAARCIAQENAAVGAVEECVA